MVGVKVKNNKSMHEIHLHTHDSNINMVEVVTKIEQYIEKAKELGLNGIVVTNHGVMTNWYNNKKKIEEAGFKYVHAVESYVTWDLTNKIRDNFHLSLYAKNFEGFKELNKMISKSFNRDDGHYYYNPRIAWDEIKATSENIIISTACLGGLMWKLDEERQKEVIDFLSNNKERVFLEVQPHSHGEQKELNARLSKLSKETGIPLIAGGDVHALDYEHDKTRKILQKSKNVCFEDEDSFDLTLKGYEYRYEDFQLQGALSDEEIETALENTNVLVDMVEPFELDYSKKYPKVVEGDSKEALMNKIREGLQYRGVGKFDKEKKIAYTKRVKHEIETYEANGAIDYLLLEDLVKSHARYMKVKYGYGRGSVTGSIVAYLMQITEMDSIERNLNFERFMSKERISLADIDTDFSPRDRHIVQEFIINGIPNVYSAPIMTANTMAIKSAIKGIGRGLDMPLDVTEHISETVEDNEIQLREEYPVLFKHVDICQGVITSIGQHACGIVISPIPLDENMGLITTSDAEYPLTMLNMKEVDAQNYVKLDILGLDSVQIIADACEMAGIEYLVPTNMDIDDEKVWDSIREDNTNIFQWESDFAKQIIQDLFSKETIRKIKAVNPNFSYMDLLSLGNAIIRPAGASYRDDVIQGNFYDNGHKALNDFLAPTLGRLVYQEQLIQFLVEFCQYSAGHADILRRGIGKKDAKIMDKEVPLIKDEFVKTMVKLHGMKKEDAESIADPFIQVFIDSAEYGFSINHSDAYSFLGYAMGWLRYYYPLEFLTACLNANKTREAKVNKLLEYTKSKNVQIKPIKFGFSKSEFMFSKEENAIYQGIEAVKYLNEEVGNSLYDFKQKYGDSTKTFLELLIRIYDNTTYKASRFEEKVMCTKCKKLHKKSLDLTLAFTEEQSVLLYEDGVLSVANADDSLKVYEAEMKLIQDCLDACSKCTTKVIEEVEELDILDLYKSEEAIALILEHDKKKNTVMDIDNEVNINSRQMKILINLNFFSEYGKNKSLLKIFDEFDKKYKSTLKMKTKIERYRHMVQFTEKEMLVNESLSLSQQSTAEMAFLGHVVSIRENMSKNIYFVSQLMVNKQNVRFFGYQYATGKMIEFKANNRVYNSTPVLVGDIIEIQKVSIKPKSVRIGGNWMPSPTEKTFWIDQMKYIRRGEELKL